MIDKLFNNKMAIIYCLAFIISLVLIFLISLAFDGTEGTFSFIIPGALGVINGISSTMLFIWLVIKIALYIKNK